MTRDEAFEFLDRIARGIAQMFGSSCETLVHDMADPSHPILAIYNGHVSGREVGSTLDVLGTARPLDASAATADLVNTAAITPDGRQIKSSTFHLFGTDGLHRVSFDQAVKVMKQTGKDLPSLYKETSEGGLAKELE